MEEWLALPGPCSDPIELSAWSSKLAELGFVPVVDRDGPLASWIEISPLRLRGYVILEGVTVDAINFELHDSDPASAFKLIETAAAALGWELYQEDDDDSDS